MSTKPGNLHVKRGENAADRMVNHAIVKMKMIDSIHYEPGQAITYTDKVFCREFINQKEIRVRHGEVIGQYGDYTLVQFGNYRETIHKSHYAHLKPVEVM